MDERRPPIERLLIVVYGVATLALGWIVFLLVGRPVALAGAFAGGGRRLLERLR